MLALNDGSYSRRFFVVYVFTCVASMKHEIEALGLTFIEHIPRFINDTPSPSLCFSFRSCWSIGFRLVEESKRNGSNMCNKFHVSNILLFILCLFSHIKNESFHARADKYLTYLAGKKFWLKATFRESISLWYFRECFVFRQLSEIAERRRRAIAMVMLWNHRYDCKLNAKWFS